MAESRLFYGSSSSSPYQPSRLPSSSLSRSAEQISIPSYTGYDCPGGSTLTLAGIDSKLDCVLEMFHQHRLDWEKHCHDFMEMKSDSNTLREDVERYKTTSNSSSSSGTPSTRMKLPVEVSVSVGLDRQFILTMVLVKLLTGSSQKVTRECSRKCQVYWKRNVSVLVL